MRLPRKEHTVTANMEYAVVLACDSNYAPYAFFVAKQIATMHPNRNFDICIFSQDVIKAPEGLNELGVKLEIISGDNPFSNGPYLSRHGAATYLRLLIPPLVLGRYSRLLYLDSDIFVENPGIDRLFSVDMLNAPIAAVRDNLQWRTPKRIVPEFKALGLPSIPYFNAGVLLIDVARYDAENILGQCLDLLAKHPSVLRRHDQSLLNLTLKGRWAELSPVWNWQYTWSSRFFADLAEPRLIHFIGPRKPWKDSHNALPARYRNAYATFIETNYPGHKDIAAIEGDALGWPENLGKVFIKHLLSATAMKKYLDRFYTDLVLYRSM
jgi:lipopolysaccharide biosynthesis glycosyltransferase